MFRMDVAKVDRDVPYVASALEACCKCFRDILRAFVQNVSSVSDVCCMRFYLDVAYVSHLCCKSMFEMFQLYHSYVAISVFMLQFANILSEYCICFTHML